LALNRALRATRPAGRQLSAHTLGGNAISKLAIDAITASSVLAALAWIIYAFLASAWIPAIWQVSAASFFVTASWLYRAQPASLLPLQLVAAGGLASISLAVLQGLIWPGAFTIFLVVGIPVAGILVWTLRSPASLMARAWLLACALASIAFACALLSFQAGWLIWLHLH
jgi:hypothetical protein